MVFKLGMVDHGSVSLRHCVTGEDFFWVRSLCTNRIPSKQTLDEEALRFAKFLSELEESAAFKQTVDLDC